MLEAVDEVRAGKEALRQRMRAERGALDESRVRVSSAAVCRRVLALPALAAAPTVALYSAIANEIDPSAIARALLARGARVCYPRIVDRRLAFCLVQSLDELRPGTFQIPAPPEIAPQLRSDELDLVIVPALAFDRRGHRLGYGRGYYDGELAAAPRALRIGVAYSFQLVDELPVETTDQPVDVIITEDEARPTGARPHLGPLEVST